MQEKAKEQHLLVILAGGGYSYHPRWPATLQPPSWLAVTPICQVTHHLGQQWPSGRGSDGLHSINDISLWCGCAGMCPSSCFPLCRGKKIKYVRIHCMSVDTHLYIPMHVFMHFCLYLCVIVVVGVAVTVTQPWPAFVRVRDNHSKGGSSRRTACKLINKLALRPWTKSSEQKWKLQKNTAISRLRWKLSLLSLCSLRLN